VSSTLGGRGGGRGADAGPSRPTGRGTADDVDQPQGRPVVTPPEEPKVEAWQAAPVTDEQLRTRSTSSRRSSARASCCGTGTPAACLCRGLLRTATKSPSGRLSWDVPLDKGHVVVFAHNPMWRGETQGTYGLVFNAILNFDQLNAGRKYDDK